MAWFLGWQYFTDTGRRQTLARTQTCLSTRFLRRRYGRSDQPFYVFVKVFFSPFLGESHLPSITNQHTSIKNDFPRVVLKSWVHALSEPQVNRDLFQTATAIYAKLSLVLHQIN